MRGPQMLKNLSPVRKVAKCNFKSKAQVHEKHFFFNEMNGFAMQKTDFHEFSFFAEKSF